MKMICSICMYVLYYNCIITRSDRLPFRLSVVFISLLVDAIDRYNCDIYFLRASKTAVLYSIKNIFFYNIWCICLLGIDSSMVNLAKFLGL